jgi:DNA primase
MANYSEETIRQVLAANDIADVVGAYFPLKRAGRDFRATCPFHNEKTPSFYVSPSRQTFHCFGCGAHGTAIRFVMDYENVDFRTALKKLADKGGIALPEDAAPDPEAERQQRRRGKILAVLGEAARFFHRLLADDPAAARARAYLEKRGLDRRTSDDWSLGYAPEALRPLADWAKGLGFKARDLIDAGLVSPKDEENPRAGVYARFRDRLMFPIRNDYGDVIAFSGRVLDPDAKTAKYVNSPETAVFQKGRVLFGLDRAKRAILKAGHALVCEGQMDLISLVAAGFDNSVAPLGTALTPDHARLLKRHTEAVLLCYDGDAAGAKAADRAFFELAKSGLTVTVAGLPPGEDPDSVLRGRGAEALRAVLAAARPYLTVFFERHAATLRGGDLAARTAVARDAAACIAAFSDPLMRESSLQEAAMRLGLDPALLRDEVRRAARSLENEARREAGRESRNEAAAAPPAAPGSPFERAFAALAALALSSLAVRAFLRAREVDGWQALPGWDLLARVLASDADPADPAALNAFASGLGPAAESRLLAGLGGRVVANPEAAARECATRIDELLRKTRIQEITSRLRDPGLPIDEVLRLQKLVVDLQAQVGHNPKSSSTAGPVLDPDPPPEDPF